MSADSLEPLKDCPFCGNPAERKENDYKVACSDSGTCPASQQWSDPEDWNRRSPSRPEVNRASCGHPLTDLRLTGKNEAENYCLSCPEVERDKAENHCPYGGHAIDGSECRYCHWKASPERILRDFLETVIMRNENYVSTDDGIAQLQYLAQDAKKMLDRLTAAQAAKNGTCKVCEDHPAFPDCPHCPSKRFHTPKPSEDK